jgi:hypothetical protein
MLLHRHVAAVHVYDVCEALKRVERNTDGQHDVERGGAHRQRDQRERLRDGAREEVEILKEKQNENGMLTPTARIHLRARALRAGFSNSLPQR